MQGRDLTLESAASLTIVALRGCSEWEHTTRSSTFTPPSPLLDSRSHTMSGTAH
jgi:hypothetical protein